MSRHKDEAGFRCARCRMQPDLCLCASLPKIATRTSVLLVLHRSEDRKSTNTGRLVAACLPNSRVVVRGHADDRDAPIAWGDDTEPVLLFPHEDAVPLTRELAAARPLTLVVPDGTWRQAAKVRKRVPALAALRAVTLPFEAPSRYRLRRGAHPAGLATMEAVARALGILEGPEVRRALEEVFRAMVDRTLWSRGDVTAAEVSGGIPAGAKRHAPRAERRPPPSDAPPPTPTSVVITSHGWTGSSRR